MGDCIVWPASCLCLHPILHGFFSAHYFIGIIVHFHCWAMTKSLHQTIVWVTCCDVTKSLHQTIIWVTHAVTWLVILFYFISGTVQDNEILHTHSNHKNGPPCKLLWLSIRNFVFCPLSCILQVELMVIICILCQTRTVKLSAIWAFCLCATGEFICLGILKGLTPWKCLCMFCFMDSMEFTGDRQFPQYL